MVVEDFDFYDEELCKLFCGRKVILREDLESDMNIDGTSVGSNVASRKGTIVTIRNIWNNNKGLKFPRFEIYEDNGWSTYNMLMVEAFIEEIDDTEQSEIQVGDLCRIKESSELSLKKTRRKYNGLKIYQSIKGANSLRQEMKGATLIVRDIVDGKVLPYYIDGDYKDGIIYPRCLEQII